MPKNQIIRKARTGTDFTRKYLKKQQQQQKGERTRTMRTATWAAINRMEHPPVMVNELITALKTTRPWREALSLSEHVAKRAIEEKMISATRTEKQLLGLPTPKGRDRSGRRGGGGGGAAPSSSAPEGGESAVSSSSLTSSSQQNEMTSDKFAWPSKVGRAMDLNSLVPISADGLMAFPSHHAGDAFAMPSLLANKQAPKIARIDVLDCTFGGGHHSRALLEGGDPFTRVAAIDCDLDVAAEADELTKEFGEKRFRFFANKMSNALSMFGESKFDFIVVDPGPNAMQLFDPSRGFVLDGGENNHSLDLRYSALFGTSALKWLNAEEIIAASTAIANVGLLKFQTAHLVMMYLKDRRPLTGSADVLSVLSTGRFGDLPEDTWVTQVRDKDLSVAMRFVLSLRAVINNEAFELSKVLQDSMLMLKPHGHVAVFTRHGFEQKIVTEQMEQEPYALLAYRQRVEQQEVEEFGVPRGMAMSLFRKLDKPAAVLANSVKQITPQQQAESNFIRMTGLHTSAPGGKNSFPANNFTFHGFMDKEEHVTFVRNQNGPERDKDWRHEAEDKITRPPKHGRNH